MNKMSTNKKYIDKWGRMLNEKLVNVPLLYLVIEKRLSVRSQSVYLQKVTNLLLIIMSLYCWAQIKQSITLQIEL